MTGSGPGADAGAGAAAGATISRVFSVEQRDRVRDRVVRMAEGDGRVVAAAVVGSLAADAGDRFSDLDLTFGISDDVSVGEVLDDWTATLAGELRAVRLADLERGPTVYRVFLLPDALQLDVSMTPAAHFRPAGPRFQLLFGETRSEAPDTSAAPPPAVAQDVFGWGVVYALHARACIERGRVWQAEHYVGAVRDRALALACLRHGLPPAQARHYDDLPAETLDRFEQTHVGALEPAALRKALATCVRELLREAAEAGLEAAEVIAERLAELR